uniref:RNA-dependent RNA polymerase n=1 Tax=Gigaspora rosea mitovirus 2 TaxID=2933358 RepID=A0A9Y0T6P6_9VIRU|nr:TPA_asm: RNA-dependent RNA polymerase [Gigaspora rosea mitovirus 2]
MIHYNRATNYIMTQPRLELAQIAVCFLFRNYLGVGHLRKSVSAWTEEVGKRCLHRGEVDTIAWIKEIRLACTRYLCGQPLLAPSGPLVRLRPDGLPAHWISALFVARDPTLVRAGLTLLSVSRVLPGWKSPDLSSITAPSQIVNSDEIARDLVGVVRELGWKIDPTSLAWGGCHVSTKSGPNAQAMLGSIEDASLLTSEQISHLQTVGGEELVSTIGTIRRLSVPTWLRLVGLKRPKGFLGRLSLIKDKEAKCRIIAILDYWTQSALLPLHKALMGHLKTLKSDCTFNQGSFMAKLPVVGPYYSMDLSSATDRLPVVIQEQVLAEMISKEYAAAWRALICDRDYMTSWGNPSQRHFVRYACGQPMGAYSSWTAFAVTHHAIVRLCAKRAGFPVSWSEYVLLGDDIVLTNSVVAEQYRAIMQQLGVEISETKTHVGQTTYEFAKRWIHERNEVSPAPLGSFLEAIRLRKERKPESTKSGHPAEVKPSGVFSLKKSVAYVSYYELATWLREVEKRWLPRSSTLVSRGLCAELLSLLLPGGYPYRLAEKAWRFFLLPSREDSRSLRATKTRILGLELAGGKPLTCFASRTSQRNLMVLLNECKARVIEEALKRQHKRLVDFQLELPKYLELVPEGLDAQSLLLSLPPFAALRQNIAQLQLEFDKAHKVRESDDLMHWLHLEVRLFLDPFEAMSTRTSKTVAQSKATILNTLTAMTKAVVQARAVALEIVSKDITDFRVTPDGTALVWADETIKMAHLATQRFSTVPTSGNIRRKVKKKVRPSSKE